MRTMLLCCLAACTVGDPSPAAPGSVSADEAAEVRQIAVEAAEVSRLAEELTSLVDESRRQVAAGTSTREAEVARMRALMEQIETKNAALQVRWSGLDARVHERAGDAAWPPIEDD